MSFSLLSKTFFDLSGERKRNYSLSKEIINNIAASLMDFMNVNFHLHIDIMPKMINASKDLSTLVIGLQDANGEEYVPTGQSDWSIESGNMDNYHMSNAIRHLVSKTPVFFCALPNEQHRTNAYRKLRRRGLDGDAEGSHKPTKLDGEFADKGRGSIITRRNCVGLPAHRSWRTSGRGRC